MAQVKLDLANKNVAEKIQKGRVVSNVLGSPASAPYTNLAAVLAAATESLENSHEDAEAKDLIASAAHVDQDTAERAFDTAYAALGGQVQVSSGGVENQITAAGYEVRSERAPVTSLDAVDAFAVTTTNSPGVLDFTWDRSRGEVSYELRGRKPSDPAGQYSFSKATTKTRLRGTGFESGVPYEFQVRANGTRELVSPWSDPFTKIAS